MSRREVKLLPTTMFEGQRCFISTFDDVVAGDRVNAVATSANADVLQPVGSGRGVRSVQRIAGRVRLYFEKGWPESLDGDPTWRVLLSLRVLRETKP